MQFVVEERKKNPDFQPPEAFFALMARIKPLMDGLPPVVEARLKGVAVDSNPA